VQVEQITPLTEDGQAGDPHATHGLVQVVLPPGMGWRYGDRLSLEGLLQTPPEDEDFSYRAYLLRQNVHTYLPFPRVERLSQAAGSPILAKIFAMREWAYAKIYQLFPSPEAPLLAGILLGIESDLPPGVARAFQDTGTAHIIAISGFNIAILAELFMKLFSKALSRWWAVLAAVLAIAGYTILVGGMPSVVRAAVMGSMALVAVQIGRRSTGANSLAFTAALM
jgi:competence protein ComEC